MQTKYDSPGMSVIPIATGSVWRHKNGFYIVLLIANNEGDDPEKNREYPVTIVYCSLTVENSYLLTMPPQKVERIKFWAGRADDWHRRMKLVRHLNVSKMTINFAREEVDFFLTDATYENVHTLVEAAKDAENANA